MKKRLLLIAAIVGLVTGAGASPAYAMLIDVCVGASVTVDGNTHQEQFNNGDPCPDLPPDDPDDPCPNWIGAGPNGGVNQPPAPVTVFYTQACIK